MGIHEPDQDPGYQAMPPPFNPLHICHFAQSHPSTGLYRRNRSNCVFICSAYVENMTKRGKHIHTINPINELILNISINSEKVDWGGIFLLNGNLL